MTHHSTSAQARYVAWARKGMCTWFAARKRAVQLWRDGMAISAICAGLGVAKQWLHKWIRRFRDGGKHWDALRDRSSRPHETHRTRDQHVAAVLEAKAKWPHLGAVKLQLVANLPVSHGTVTRILREHGAPRRKKLWRTYRRFRRPYANYLWQIDITPVPTKGPWAHIATVLDDHSRCVLASRVFEKDLNQADTIQLVRQAVKFWGRPRQILTDHGAQFDTVAEEPSLFTQALDAWGIQHIMGRPHHPRTQGKIERWHRSLKHEWFGYHSVQEDTEGVRRILRDWVDHYNTERPHWSLALRTPLEVYLESSSVVHELGQAVNEVLG